jgi:hypothetical protein
MRWEAALIAALARASVDGSRAQDPDLAAVVRDTIARHPDLPVRLLQRIVALDETLQGREEEVEWLRNELDRGSRTGAV